METWSLLRPDLCVHVYVKSESLPNVWAQGWINYMDVLPLCDDGSSPPQPAVADYAMQRAIQVSSRVHASPQHPQLIHPLHPLIEIN